MLSHGGHRSLCRQTLRGHRVSPKKFKEGKKYRAHPPAPPPPRLLSRAVFEWTLIHRGEPFRLRDNSRPESKVVHLVIRLYGALILAQGLVVWNARKVADAAMRRSMITALLQPHHPLRGEGDDEADDGGVGSQHDLRCWRRLRCG